MSVTKTSLVEAIKLFAKHFDITTPQLKQRFIVAGDAVGLVCGAYSSVGGDIEIYLRRNTHVNVDDPIKYQTLVGLFSGETLSNWGGVTQITVKLNQFTFKVSPQPEYYEESEYTTLDCVMDLLD